MTDKFADVSPELMAQYKDAFRLFDGNQDGVIDKEEFAEVTKSIGIDQSAESIQHMIDTIGSDDKVTFNQFIGVMSGKMKNMDTEDDVLEAFKIFDPEGTGKVKAEDLSQALTIFCHNLTEAERNSLINEAGLDDAGFITYEPFVKKLFDFS